MSHDNDVMQPGRLRSEIARLQQVHDSISTTRGEVGARRRREDLSSRIAYLSGVLGDSTRR